MKFMLRHITPVIFICLLISCKERVTQEELIQAALEIKLNQWRESQIDACRENALMKAEQYVDSLLLANSLETKLDTIPKPGKPTKPSKPSFKTKPDSVVVDPIIKKKG